MEYSFLFPSMQKLCKSIKKCIRLMVEKLLASFFYRTLCMCNSGDLYWSEYCSLLIKGYRKPLTREDLWSLNPEDKCHEVYPAFEKSWLHEMAKFNR